jgi:hypothetical protein
MITWVSALVFAVALGCMRGWVGYKRHYGNAKTTSR